MTLPRMAARRAASTHRSFWISLRRVGASAVAAGAVLVLAGGCESNGLLFSAINRNTPVVGGDASPPGEGEPPTLPEGPDRPSESDAGLGGASSSAAGAGGSAGTPGAGTGGVSASAGQGGDAPPSDGEDEPDAGGSAGAGGAGGAGAGGGGATAEPPPNDFSCGNACLRGGGRCFEGTCHFDCEEPGSCDGEQVICPPGRPCEVRCGDDACVNNVICRPGAQCNILCEGEGSCAAQVICEGECDVRCSGPGSCRSGIGGAVELLQLECSGARSCAATVSCEGQDCQLECSGPGSCGRVRTLAVDNVVTCSGPGSCAGDFICLGATCDYACADDACESGVDCRSLRCTQSDY